MVAGTYGGYESTDLLQVRVNRGGLVEYVKNDEVFYTSTEEEFGYPLGVDSSFNNPSGNSIHCQWSWIEVGCWVCRAVGGC